MGTNKTILVNLLANKCQKTMKRFVLYSHSNRDYIRIHGFPRISSIFLAKLYVHLHLKSIHFHNIVLLKMLICLNAYKTTQSETFSMQFVVFFVYL